MSLLHVKPTTREHLAVVLAFRHLPLNSLPQCRGRRAYEPKETVDCIRIGLPCLPGFVHTLRPSLGLLLLLAPSMLTPGKGDSPSVRLHLHPCHFQLAASGRVRRNIEKGVGRVRAPCNDSGPWSGKTR
ncbi:hypothetical protein Naga_101358g2, partial [Nannochloropsis gaditana]